MYRIYIADRNYQSWKFTELETNKEISPETTQQINPHENHLFNNDIISQTGQLVYSYVRECPSLAGMLIIEKNKTYGRTENKKRLLYKCIPDDKRLPAFLVPYDIKLGFSKHIINKYVVFKFDTWTTDHPRGTLIEVLGDIDKLEVFYEYKLYCRNLNISNKEFTKKTHQLFKPTETEQYIKQIQSNSNFTIEDHTDRYVFTIDPKNSLDFDDGFSIATNENQETTITIYIANVFLWLETFQLWESFNKRVCTIYLPDRRRPMLPTVLSDNLCSLIENQPRFAFCMDIEVSQDGKIQKTRYYNSLIKVRRNFTYEESALLKNQSYKKLLEITNQLSENNFAMDSHTARPKPNRSNATDSLRSSSTSFKAIEDSHDLVTFWMIYMNKQCGIEFYKKQTGIYRSVFSKDSIDKNTLQRIDSNAEIRQETKQFMKNWLSIYGQYVVFNENQENIEHSLLNLRTYVHITSPIRRLVDLLNQILFLRTYELIKEPSKEAQQFVAEWIQQIDVINERMKSTAKVERECEIMRKCLTNPRILETAHNAYIINKHEHVENGRPKYKYILYLENERIVLTIKTEESRELYKNYKVRLYKIESYGIASKIKVVWDNA